MIAHAAGLPLVQTACHETQRSLIHILAVLACSVQTRQPPGLMTASYWHARMWHHDGASIKASKSGSMLYLPFRPRFPWLCARCVIQLSEVDDIDAFCATAHFTSGAVTAHGMTSPSTCIISSPQRCGCAADEFRVNQAAGKQAVTSTSAATKWQLEADVRRLLLEGHVSHVCKCVYDHTDAIERMHG